MGHKNLIFWLVKSVLSGHHCKYAGIHHSIVYFTPSIGMMLSPNLKHKSWLHSSRSLPFAARWMTMHPRASSDSFLLLVPWITPSLATCTLSLLDCLWSARSLAPLWVTTYYGLWLAHPKTTKDLGSYVCGTHLGSRRLHVKIIGGWTSNLYVLIIEQMHS
jgi:hypothetical protein